MTSVLKSITKYSLALYFLLLPLYFLPFTFDILEMNKTIFIMVFALFWLVILALINFTKKSLNLTSSYLFVPTIALLLVYLASAVFSISTSYTLWGFYGFLSNSLPAIILLLLLPIIISSIVDSKSQLTLVVPSIVTGLFAVVLFSFVSYFQLLPQSGLMLFLSNISINTAGGYVVLKYVVVLAALMSAVGFITAGKNLIMQVYYTVVMLFSLVLAILALPLSYIVLALIAVLVPFVIYKNSVGKEQYITLGAALLIVVAVLLFNFIPSLKSSAGLNKPVPNEVSLSFNDSWFVSNRVVGQRPLFGSGPSTFVYNYTVNKPANINGTDLWDTLFVKPSSFYLLVLAEAGILGFAALIFYLVRLVLGALRTIRTSFKTLDPVLVGLYIALAMFMLFFFTTPGNAFVLGMFFGLVGLVLSYQKVLGLLDVGEVSINLSGVFTGRHTSTLLSTDKKAKSVPYLHFVFAFLVLLVVGFYTYFIGKVFVSDIVFAGYFNKPQTLLDLRSNYQKAASINPRNDFYQRSIIDVNQRIATVLLNPEKPKDLSKDDVSQTLQDVQTLLDESARRATFITSGTDLGLNVKNWEAKGLLFQSRIGLVNDAAVNALQAYNVAASLNPNNPRIIASIGSVYYVNKNYQAAAQAFERAVLLKSDYAAARYNLAKTYEQLKQYSKALAVARTVLALLPQDSPDKKDIEDYIKTIEPKAKEEQDAIAKQQKLKLNENGKPTEQPAITEPGKPLQPASKSGQQTPKQVIPTPTAVPTDTPSPTENPTAPGQDLNTKPGSGFIENK